MKTLIIIYTLLTLYSCVDDSKPSKEKINYFYLSHKEYRSRIDTFKYGEVNQIESVDQLLATEFFEFQGKAHTIKMYSSDNTAPVDGGELKYTLDDIGIIYQRAVWWPNFSRLKSNNDSINDLVNTAFGYIIMRKSLRCFYCDESDTYKPEPLKLK